MSKWRLCQGGGQAGSVQKIYSVACPKLVPLVEKGIFHGPQVRSALTEYTAPLLALGVECIILAVPTIPFLKGGTYRKSQQGKQRFSILPERLPKEQPSWHRVYFCQQKKAQFIITPAAVLVVLKSWPASWEQSLSLYLESFGRRIMKAIDFQGQKIAVVWSGDHNLALIDFLESHGADNIIACDRQAVGETGAQRAETRERGIKLQLAGEYLKGLDECDLIFLTPGMRRDWPELEQAKAKGVRLSSEIALFELVSSPLWASQAAAARQPPQL